MIFYRCPHTERPQLRRSLPETLPHAPQVHLHRSKVRLRGRSILFIGPENSPRSQHAQAHLNVLTSLLSTNPQRVAIARFLVSHGFYSLLRNAVLQLVRLLFSPNTGPISHRLLACTCQTLTYPHPSCYSPNSTLSAPSNTRRVSTGNAMHHPNRSPSPK